MISPPAKLDKPPCKRQTDRHAGGTNQRSHRSLVHAKVPGDRQDQDQMQPDLDSR